MNAQWRKLHVSKFSKECCPAATRPPSVVVHSGNLGNACCSVLRINPNLLGAGEFRASRTYCAGPNRGRNHGVVQAAGPTTRSLANTTFRRSHTTMSAASKRAKIIAWGTLDGMKTVVNVNQRAVFVSIRTGIM